ncbi:RICIN domain-containing protein [Streptomyces sp. NPDC059970]|uniref:RICIN domain-containing protein n=1 Tax=Streptomyces sp. NPDC059970 TaxID=3347019 RepID=UPI0036808F0A
MVKAGRPQGGLKGQTEQANALAAFLRNLTKDFTVRELAERYKISKTSWGEYRAGTKTIELHLLQHVIQDLVRDERARAAVTARAEELHQLAKAAENSTPPPTALRTGGEPPDQVLSDADADVRESKELLQALREVIAHLQAAPPAPPKPNAPGRTGDPDHPPAADTLGEATEQLARMEELQATAEAVRARAREQLETHEAAEADAPPPIREPAPLAATVPATDPALAEIALILAQVRTALDAQRQDISELATRIGLPLRTPASSPAVVVAGEVLHRPPAPELALVSGEPKPRWRRLRKQAVTSVVVTIAVVTLAAGGWYFTHQQPAGSAAAAPVPPQTTTAPTSAAPTPPASPSGSTKPTTTPQPSRTPRTVPPTAKEPTASPRATRSAMPAAPPLQWGHITNGNSALCLAVPAASRQSGKHVNQYPCGDYSDHYWKTEPAPHDAQSNGLVRIVNYNSRQCLSVADSSTETAAPVVQSTCEQSEGQYWQLEEHPDGTWVINANSGQCLAVPAASTQPLTEVNQYPCGDYPDHYWHLEGR